MFNITASLAGSLVGLVLGIVGGGGSIIAVPLLLYVVGIPSAHVAIGTSAVAVAISAFANLLNQLRRGLVKWPCALVFSAAGVLGNYAGSTLALRVPGQGLLFAFGLLMLIVGITMLLRKNAEGDPDVRLSIKTARHMLPWLLATGLGVGALSGFFGIGGGFLIVPAMMLATGMPIANAIATSLVSITVFGAATSANYAMAGMVDWNIAGNFVLGGIIGGIVGTAISGRLQSQKGLLNMVFAGFVIAIGCYVAYKGGVSAQ
jgi:uncharacterized membrane protein YfcA